MYGRFFVFTCAYAVAIVVGRMTVPDGATLAIFWPASGVGALWAITCTRTGERRAAAAAIAGISVGGNSVLHGSLGAAVLLGAANVLISFGTARVLGAAEGDGRAWRLHGLSDFYRLLGAAVIASLVSLGPGMAAILAAGDVPGWGDALAWVMRHSASVVVVVGTVFALTRPPRHSRRSSGAEIFALFGLTVLAEWAVFGPGHRLPLSFVPFVLLFWSGVRTSVRVAVGHSGLVGVLTLVLVCGFQGGSFAAIDDPAMQAVTLQVFVFLTTSLSIVLAMAWEERGRLARDLAALEAAARLRAEDLTAVTQTIPDGLLVVDRDGRILLHNEAAKALFDDASTDSTAAATGDAPVPRVEVLARHHLDGREFTRDERPSVRALAGEHVRGLLVRSGVGAGREGRIYSVSASPLHDATDATDAADTTDAAASAGPADRAVLLLRDVTAEHARSAELDVSRRRAERLFSDAPTGVVVLDLSGTILRVNSAAAALLLRDPADLVGRPLADLATRPEQVARHLAQTVEQPARRHSFDWTVAPGTDDAMQVTASTGVLAGSEDSEDVVLAHLLDVTERRTYERRLAHLAEHDALTGLPNRRRFDRLLSEHLSPDGAEHPSGAMLLLDLDNFKEVNDTLGHGAGDELLVSLSSELRHVVGDAGVVARLGGDEFAVLLPDADHAGARSLAEDLVAVVRQHTAALPGVHHRVTVSVGAITFAAAAQHDADPLALADMLLYDSKDSGRDCFTLLAGDGSLAPRSGARLAWRARLEAALDADDFELYLQPIMNLRTGDVDSAEALLRLTDVPGEAVSPYQFMEIAEQAGLAPRIDAWVLGRAARLIADLRRREPEFRLEVNLSGRSVGDPAIEATLEEALRRHRVDPGALILEITETAVVADLRLARHFAERVRALGARFALDDFGAGYGSFAYLKHLPFDYIKIDGEFVAQVDTSPIDRAIVRSIAGIARELGKKTVAEFVATDDVLDVVREEGIDFAQGYAVGKPVPAREFVATWLQDRLPDVAIDVADVPAR
ncbi:PAS domain S-box-containing protein/diguanylate cyclase (GGDEF) domain-containing protein [Nocardioides terrae]|uniref:PAS domain S-box-containing protein/diguanylate cyclase (GGDEF) domain-containing protein n=1 Tax=Nocardioides terrae TaxID=574651 RepID=A0A1I1KDG3_9ACTN|nr:EAL domain-containing protein [Nocardioides terrae]SFC56163.1 PAS domain S-box-containing protein/diguanylate cyclase (GGDEF) domain-containing protein [Nocardioides terrae]